MDCQDVTVGRFFVGKMPPAALHQAIIVLKGGTPFHPFEILMVRAQVWGDVPFLNKTGKTPLIPLRDQEWSWEQPGHGIQVPISYPHWGIMTLPQSWRVEGKLHWAPSQSYPWSCSLPLLHMLSPDHRPWGCWQADSGGAESPGWSGGVMVLEPHKGPETLGVILPVEVPGSTNELVASPVMMVASELGTPAAQRRVSFSLMASSLAWIATRIWTFSSCAHTSSSFWRRRSFVF